MYVCMYVYIHIYTHIFIYINIYSYVGAKKRERTELKQVNTEPKRVRTRHFKLSAPASAELMLVSAATPRNTATSLKHAHAH